MPDSIARKRGRPRTATQEPESKTVQSLDKALVVLKTVSEHSGLSLTEIAEQTGLSSPTVYRALLTMQQHGLVNFDEARQLWAIGLEAFRIGSAFLRSTSIVEQARPVMQDLMNDTGETANLGIMDGGEVVFLSQAETHEPIRAFHRPGSKAAIHASGVGKALFAYLDDSTARDVLAEKQLDSFTTKTITDIDALLSHRNQIRKQGYAFDDEERTLGMRCIAAPVFNVHGEAVAALSVSGPTVRIDDDAVESLAKKVIDSANTITRNIGGRTPSEHS